MKSALHGVKQRSGHKTALKRPALKHAALCTSITIKLLISSNFSSTLRIFSRVSEQQTLNICTCMSVCGWVSAHRSNRTYAQTMVCNVCLCALCVWFCFVLLVSSDKCDQTPLTRLLEVAWGAQGKAPAEDTLPGRTAALLRTPFLGELLPC